jgi:hypothetical protein
MTRRLFEVDVSSRIDYDLRLLAKAFETVSLMAIPLD